MHIVYIVHVHDMRKIFNNRSRLLVYVETEEADLVEMLARKNGQTTQEWLREALRSSIEGDVDYHNNPKEQVKKCPHGIEVGFRCTLCGGKVK